MVRDRIIGCGKLKEFGTMHWYRRDTLAFDREELDSNRVPCGGLDSYTESIKLCKACAVKAGAEW